MEVVNEVDWWQDSWWPEAESYDFQGYPDEASMGAPINCVTKESYAEHFPPPPKSLGVIVRPESTPVKSLAQAFTCDSACGCDKHSQVNDGVNSYSLDGWSVFLKKRA